MDWDFILTSLACIIACACVLFIFYICSGYFMKLIFTIVKINKMVEEEQIRERKKKYDYKES